MRPKHPWIWLLLGGLFLPFVALQTVLPPAAWLAPVFLLRYVRTTRRLSVAWGGFVLVHVLADLVAFRNGFLPFPAVVVVAIVVVAAVVRSTAYLLDRLLARHLTGLWQTLAFPAAMTAVEWAAARLAPFGTWGAAAYSQVDVLPLVQLASVTGLWGVTFLVFWLAPVAHALWEARLDLRAVRRVAVPFGCALGVVLLAGSARLAFAPPESPRVPVAAVALPAAWYARTFDGLRAADLARASAAERGRVRGRFEANAAYLLRQTEAAARSGARVIAWPESFPVLQEDEARLLARAADVARRHQVYLVATPWVIRETERFPYVENLSVLIDPAGAVRWRYAKAYPVFGIEDRRMAPGPGDVPVVSTPYGRMATVICQDLDFPWLVRRAGRERADLLVAPADDWEAIKYTHGQMAVLRAIENGTSLLRSNANGVALAVDPYGRVVGAVDSYRTADPLLLSALPTRGTTTLYARFGDWFAYACLAAVAVFLGVPVRARRVGARVPA